MKRVRAPKTLPVHGHCEICGLSVDINERFCGERCRLEFERKEKRRKLRDTVILVAMSIFFVIFFLIPLITSITAS